MTRLYLLILAAAPLAFAQADTGDSNATSADIAAGAKMFRSHCAQCHGAKGEGGLGPKLTSGIFYHGSTDRDLYNNITGGIPGTAMPGSFFEGTQAWQLVAYVRSLSRMSTSATPPGDPLHGAALFREKGCSGCHLVNGEGGLKGPDLSFIASQRSPEYLREAILDPNATVATQYWVAKISLRSGASYTGYIMNEDTHIVQLFDFSRGLQSLPRTEIANLDIDKRSIMPSYNSQLTAQQLDDLIAYLSTLRRQRVSE